MDSKKSDQKSLVPWIAAAVSVILAVVSTIQLVTLRIRVTNSDFREQAYYIEYSERPFDFILIETLMILVAIGAAWFAVSKFKSQSDEKKED